MKNKFRASASILWAWSRGDWENAVNMYFKLTDFDTPAMKAGREYHKKWEDYINENQNQADQGGYNKYILNRHRLRSSPNFTRTHARAHEARHTPREGLKRLTRAHTQDPIR